MNDDAEFEARVGTVLRGKWTLERLLGVGGMAAVYAARHKIGRLDAIKILHPEVARSAEMRARFEQEAHAVNRFRHAGAVEIRDIDTTEDGAPFLVMELLEGEPLSSVAKRQGALGAGEILKYADALLDVLGAAHACGIIHRDIKPDNLFLLRDGRLKVLDFGIARMREGAPRELCTRTGATLGTIAYMPPEQIKGMPIDARADLFALGATMFRLIAGRRLHEARSESELLVKMATQPAPPLQSIVPAAPSALCAIVDRALALDREQRYPDAASMQADVRAARRDEPPPSAGRLISAPAVVVRPPGGSSADAGLDATSPETPLAVAMARTIASQPLPQRFEAHAVAPAVAVPAAPLAAARRRVPLFVPLAALAAFMLILGLGMVLLCARGGGADDEPTPERAEPGPPPFDWSSKGKGKRGKKEREREEARERERAREEREREREREEREREEEERERDD
jgi:serine/threonine-protein kinase